MSRVLPGSAAVAAIVRRIVFRLNSELFVHGCKPVTDRERALFFNLDDAVKILDGVAILPGMSMHASRARRDLMELFNVYDLPVRV